MGRPPAYIFIVRHGNRLDAADKLWYLSSPTPYDPPLTYGGWTQSRAIGQRIADILRENAVLQSAPNAAGQPASSSPFPQEQPKKRRYKIAIHSSPFLRCIQTSIAISSGIASDALPLESPGAFEPLPPLNVRSPNHNVSSDGAVRSGESHLKMRVPKIHKSVLRLDAFLGEWLSPSYFEMITPPPSSSMMLASAKAELLRREDYSAFFHASNQQSVHNHSNSTSQLWGASRSNTWSSRPSNDEDLPRSGSQPIPPVGLFESNPDARPSSSSGNFQGMRWRAATNTSMHSPNLVGYVAPVPRFALSSKAPTPTGYVAHARDACIDLDYQWDSMRAPYDWGDGGEFGEEWTAMHRRFRKGLQMLIDWYTLSGMPTEMVTKTIHFWSGPPKTNSDGTVVDSAEYAIDDDDSEPDTSDDDCIEESVVILVSHGAGCNAIIGALTQQPVLMDVGLASLSVAVRRPGKEEAPPVLDTEDQISGSYSAKWSGAVHRGHPGGIVPLHEYYEMKLLASNDHLRSVPVTPTTPRPNSMATVMGVTRGRHSNSMSGTPGNSSLFDSGAIGLRSSSAGSVHGNTDFLVRRPSGASSRPAGSSRSPRVGIGATSSPNTRAASGITIGSGVKTFSPPMISTSRMNRSGSFGLWSPASIKDSGEESFTLNDGEESEDSDMEILLSFGPESPKPKETKSKPPTHANKRPGALNLLYPSSLSKIHTAGDEDRDLDATLTAAIPQLDLSSPTTTTATTKTLSPLATSTTSPTAQANAGLWLNRRKGLLGDDELRRDQSTSKRRWAVNEQAL